MIFEKKNMIELGSYVVKRYCILASKLFVGEFNDLEEIELNNEETWGSDTGLVINNPEYDFEINLRDYIDYMFEPNSVENYVYEYEYDAGVIVDLNSVLFILSDEAKYTPLFKRVVEGHLNLYDFHDALKGHIKSDADFLKNLAIDEENVDVLLTALRLTKV